MNQNVAGFIKLRGVNVKSNNALNLIFLFFYFLFSVSQSVSAKSFECLIEPSQVIELRAPIEGLIEKITVDRGDVVTSGQVLITLDTGIEKARYSEAKFKAGMRGAQLAAQSRLDFLSKKFDRNQTLFKDKYVSANDRDESESGKNLASAELTEAKENSRVAELQVHEFSEVMRLKTLKSPFDGVVMERSHHPGEVAQSNDHLAILKLARTNPLYVEVVLPAIALGKIHKGDEIHVKPNLEGVGEFKARIKVVDPVVDAATATLGVRLEVPNPEHRLPAGINCHAEFSAL